MLLFDCAYDIVSSTCSCLVSKIIIIFKIVSVWHCQNETTQDPKDYKEKKYLLVELEIITFLP